MRMFIFLHYITQEFFLYFFRPFTPFKLNMVLLRFFKALSWQQNKPEQRDYWWINPCSSCTVIFRMENMKNIKNVYFSGPLKFPALKVVYSKAFKSWSEGHLKLQRSTKANYIFTIFTIVKTDHNYSLKHINYGQNHSNVLC